MKLSEAADAYVTYRRSLGMRFLNEEARLKGFTKAMGDVELDHIDSGAVWTHLVGADPTVFRGHEKLSTLKGFYQFATAREYVSSSPLPKWVPRKPSTFAPYIYSREEIRRLVAAAENLENRGDPLRAPTIRTLVILLYGTGLRGGEALRLTVADVDFANNLLTVRDSKFHKTRLVPISSRLAAVLHAYFQKRRRWHCPITEDSPFFATRRNAVLTLPCVEAIFRKLRIRAGLYRPGRGRAQPRLHDLRHTSAVHKLVSWYREGKDVQVLLPYLATYLGHLKLSGTQRYLSMTPDLLHEVNLRFERYALTEVSHV